MASYTIKEGQTIFDVVLQLYGDMDKMYEFIQLNPTKIASILERNLVGKEVEYEVQDNEIANYYKNNNIIIATKYPQFNTLSAFSSAFSSAFTVPSTA
jgi:predicted nuclease of predicted toxin-antitoxin system